MIRERGGIASHVTRVENYLDGITDDERSIPGFKCTMESQRNIVVTMREKYCIVQEKIIKEQPTDAHRLLEENNLSAFLKRCDEITKKIDDIIAAIPGVDASKSNLSDSSGLLSFMTTFMRESERRHSEQLQMIANSLSNASTNAPVTNRSAIQKLPQINLPTFDGKFSTWISFKDRFTASVINYPGITNVQKLEYLHAAVKGDAAATIKHLAITNANFDTAWRILIDKFERKNEIVGEHIRTFFAMPKVAPSNPNAIQEIANLVSECTMALDAMEVTQRDPWVIEFALQKLDIESRVLWGRECGSTVAMLPKFIDFLSQRCVDHKNASHSATQPASTQPGHSRAPANKPANFKKSGSAYNTTATSTNCKCCNQAAHSLHKCPKFLSQNVEEKFQTVKRLGLCRNCFAGHMTYSCTFHKCTKCQGRHNVLLHEKFQSSDPSSTDPPATTSATPPATTAATPPATGSAHLTVISAFSAPPAETSSSPSVMTVSQSHQGFFKDEIPRVYIPTAVVNIFTASGDVVSCRILLDGAATVNIMTHELYERLNLPRHPTKITISGVNDGRSRAKFSVDATICSRISDATFNFRCFVLPKVSSNIPNWQVDASAINIPPGLSLADPEWSVSRPVDLLLCGNPYLASWLNNIVELGPGLPILQESVFGYVVVGEQEPKMPPEADDHHQAFNTMALDKVLTRFFELENIPEDPSITEDQMAAEEHFRTTYKRGDDGRFILELPFKKDPRVLGDSRPLAIRQQFALERRFEKNPALRSLYIDVMNDQLRNGWIEPVPDDECKSPAYYMPHHGVLKDSSSTKLRIVCNASAKTSTGFSLNDILRIGPTVQPLLAIILLRFRKGKHAMSADISKMYPQIRLAPAHFKYQQFVWRSDKSQPLRDYRVIRVCFGVASSPFMATRVLVQIARDHQNTHPLASAALLLAFYVDDFMFSTDSLEIAQQTRAQLIDVLGQYGFQLAKWSANHPELCPPNDDPNSSSEVHFIEHTTNALGLKWNTTTDVFQFEPPISPSEDFSTKRKMASAIARLFDPIGLIGPVITQAKYILQEVHAVQQEWDDLVPQDLQLKWKEFVQELQNIQNLSVPRWISSIVNPVRVELHAFADASQKAYGAAIYVVTQDSQGSRHSQLLTSKSRVAPLKKSTIPRLELCGALMAAELSDKIRPIYEPGDTYLWSDSMVVLYWIHSSTENYKIFISNRLKKIHATSQPTQWRHVSTHQNPADIISRGATPLQLQDSPLWWNGPSWLVESQTSWPPKFVREACISEEAAFLTTTENKKPNPTILSCLLERYSSLTKMQFVVSHCLRFIHNSKNRTQKIHGPHSTEELEMALEKLILLDQSEVFPGLQAHLSKNKTLDHSKFKYLSSLAPFVDEKGIVRVGGRLKNSSEPFAVKHPILLPKSRLTEMIIQQEHLRMLHAAPTLLLSTVRQRFWPLSGRNTCKKVYHMCYRCNRAKPRPLEQLMADLPHHRTSFNYAFEHTGVDFAGPIQFRPSAPRGASTRRLAHFKGYIAVFVCMSTKAVHIEFVTGLSTEVFLAAFRRFTARKATPRHMYSDCGKNFEGAARELKELLQQEQFQQGIQNGTAQDGVIWHFNPPRAPHHGGLWEACVKSIKFHLCRIIQHVTHSFEEISTILCQIEFVLNSRPIGLISSDPNELAYLTPGHFLGQTQRNALPDPDVTSLPQNRLTLWQFCQQRSQEFAKKFRLFYLNTLQQRTKWTAEKPDVIPEEVVLFFDETQAGSKWVLGQIENITPGPDGRVRVVDIRTPRGTYTRPITKIARISLCDTETSCSENPDESSEQPGEDVEDSTVGDSGARESLN